jgi:Flp pilus assembly protein TadD
MLGEVIRLAIASHARIMIASDHGFHWKEGRPTTLSSYATATAAKWHRIDGIYLLWGPGIVASGGHAGAGGVRQVCATLLALSGLPPATRLKGPPLPGAPSGERAPIDYAKFYVPAPNPATPTTKATNEALANLKALGYIGSAESSRPATAITSTKTAGAFNNEGLVLKNEGKIDAAIAAFEEAMKIDPNLSSAQWNLSDVLFQQKRDLERSNELLLRSLRNGLPDAPKYVIERAIWYQRHGDARKSLALVDAAVGVRSNDPELHMFRGRYRVELRDCAGALEDFKIVEQLKPQDPVALASAGLAEICLGDRAAATDLFRRSLAIDPNQPVLRRFLEQQ